jgi:hypothetical protein
LRTAGTGTVPLHWRAAVPSSRCLRFAQCPREWRERPRFSRSEPRFLRDRFHKSRDASRISRECPNFFGDEPHFSRDRPRFLRGRPRESQAAPRFSRERSRKKRGSRTPSFPSCASVKKVESLWLRLRPCGGRGARATTEREMVVTYADHTSVSWLSVCSWKNFEQKAAKEREGGECPAGPSDRIAPCVFPCDSAGGALPGSR